MVVPERPKKFSVAAINYATALTAVRIGATNRILEKVFLFSSK